MSSILLSYTIILDPFITSGLSCYRSVEAVVTRGWCWYNTHLVFPQTKQFPFLSLSISRTIFCPFYLLSDQKPRNQTSDQFTCVGLWAEHWADMCIKTSKRMHNIFIPTACSSSQTSRLLKVSPLLLHLCAQISEQGQQFLHHLCPFWFWTDVILHFLQRPAQINTSNAAYTSLKLIITLRSPVSATLCQAKWDNEFFLILKETFHFQPHPSPYSQLHWFVFHSERFFYKGRNYWHLRI